MLPKIHSGVLVIDRAPYHLVRNETTRPAALRFRKDQFADWLEAHNLVLAEWGPHWRTTCTRALLKKRADENRLLPGRQISTTSPSPYFTSAAYMSRRWRR